MAGETIGEALRQAVADWRVNTPRVAGAVAIFTVVEMAAIAAPALTLSPFARMGITLLATLLSMMVYGGVLRLALAPDHVGDPDFKPGPYGLQWTRTEWRLTGATLLILFFIFLIMLAVTFFAILATAVVYASQGLRPAGASDFFMTPGGLVLTAIGVVFGLILVWALMRLSLSLAATVDRKQVQVFSSWGLTKGRVGAIFVSAILISLPAILASLLTAYLRGRVDGTVLLALNVVTGLLIGVWQTPAVAGLYAWFYRHARGARLA